MGLFLDKIKAPKEKKHILYNNDLDALLYYQAKKRQKGIDYWFS